MTTKQRKVAGLAGGLVVAGVIAVVVIPGGGSSGESAGPAGRSMLSGAPAVGAAPASGGTSASGAGSEPGIASAPGAARDTSRSLESAGSALTGTRVVRTGQLSLVVPRVTTAVARLTAMASGSGGYVQSTDSSTNDGVPQADVTLRVPAGDFDAAVTAAQQLGRTQSLTTSTKDVTGRYVDLVAREKALRRTRSTYLSILSTARTIGATLSVQQRVDDVQQQLDQLEGQRRVLAAQSDDATLAISLTEKGDVVVPPAPPVSTGIGAAWHRSVHRFSVGVDAIVGVLGPLLLAVILLVIVAGIGMLGYRGVRRVVS